MSSILAFSDVHLGYKQSDSDALIAFMHELQNRDDLGDVVIVGDFVDLWRSVLPEFKVEFAFRIGDKVAVGVRQRFLHLFIGLPIEKACTRRLQVNMSSDCEEDV